MADFFNFLAVSAYWAGSLVCHQLPDRSFFWDGRQLPVCARCTGLYVSGLVGLVGWMTFRVLRRRRIAVDPRTARNLLIVVSLPTLLSLATGTIGWWDGSNLTRALLAIPPGLVAGGIVAAVASKDLR